MTAAVIQQVPVVGMNCRQCERAVATELGLIDGVQHVDVDATAGVVTVHSCHRLDLCEVGGAVSTAGCQVTT